MPSHVTLMNSTTVRAPNEPPPFARWVLEKAPLLSLPALYGRFLEPAQRELPLDLSDARRVLDLPRGVRAGIWGEGPLVLLVHGWESGGGSYDELRRALLAQGFSVACFDAPAHGKSPGRRSNAFEFAELAAAIARRTAVDAVVGHSLGAAASVVALARGVRARALVLLAPMPSFDFALDSFAQAARLPPGAASLFARHMKRRFPTATRELDLKSQRPGAEHVLIVHDERDRAVVVDHSQELAARWPNTRLLVTRGFGHRRLLGAPEVHDVVGRFLRHALPGRAAPLDRQLEDLERLSFRF